MAARRMHARLPSISGEFRQSVPLTRIRDIAHRNDIPHDLKQEIKHTLQNKLHRCAGASGGVGGFWEGGGRDGGGGEGCRRWHSAQTGYQAHAAEQAAPLR
eukprot:354792-Chlamydomonas_euryale.AAC.1